MVQTLYHVNTPIPTPPQAKQLSTPLAAYVSPHNCLYADLIAISYSALNTSDSYSKPSFGHRPLASFSQLAITILATITVN